MRNINERIDSPSDAKEPASFPEMNSGTLVRWARCGYMPAHPLGEGNRRIWRFFEIELLECTHQARLFVSSLKRLPC
jgi:hypothetical protein